MSAETLNKDLVKIISNYEGKRGNYVTFEFPDGNCDTINLAKIFKISLSHSSTYSTIIFSDFTGSIRYTLQTKNKSNVTVIYQYLINHIGSVTMS